MMTHDSLLGRCTADAQPSRMPCAHLLKCTPVLEACLGQQIGLLDACVLVRVCVCSCLGAASKDVNTTS